MSSFWTDDRVAQLTKLAGENNSAAVIANLMGAPSRNAVIGKAGRLGLTLKGGKAVAKASRPMPKSSPVKAAVARRKVEVKLAKVSAPKPAAAEAHRPVPPPVRRDLPPVGRFTIDDLDVSFRRCRWPMWSNAERSGFYCGDRTVSDTCSYCETHRARSVSVFQPGRAR